MILIISFNALEGYRDAFFWIEVNKHAVVKYTDKKQMHKVMAASRGLVYLTSLIVLANVYEIRSVLLFTFGFWLQHFLVHAGTYYDTVDELIPEAYPNGFFTNEPDGDNDSWFDKHIGFQRKFIGRAVLFFIGTLIIIITHYDILRSSYN
jgi:hypothetical protein